MPFLDTNGFRTNYKRADAKNLDSGDPAPIVVFIHGIGTDSLASFYLTLAAPLASAGIEVVAYDLKGHGRSDRPDSGYSVQGFTDDLGAVLDGLDIRRPVHLVGNSYGGTIAFNFAAQQPERVASIVSIEAEPPTENWSWKMTQLLQFTMEMLEREDTYEWIEANQGTHHARLARVAGERLKSTGMLDEIPSGRMMSEEDLQAVVCPVLNIIGGGGYQAEAPEMLQSMLPNCRTEVLEGQDHSVLVEAHRRVRELVLTWVRDHEPDGSGVPVPADRTPEPVPGA